MRWVVISVWVILVLMMGWVWWQWPKLEPRVVVCEVGQGDGIVVTQGFSQMVIDVGRDDEKMISCLEKTLPFWDKTLEMVVISHADGDHIGGLSRVARHYQIEKLATSETSLPEVEALELEEVEVEAVNEGQSWSWGEVEVEVVWPPKLELMEKELINSNDAGVVLRLSFENNKSMWLAGDAGSLVEEKLLENGKVRPATVLKVSHHGSRDATTKPFLEILRPRVSVVSVGKNSYGHPTEDTLNRLAGVGSEIWRTDMRGGFEWWVNR